MLADPVESIVEFLYSRVESVYSRVEPMYSSPVLNMGRHHTSRAYTVRRAAPRLTVLITASGR